MRLATTFVSRASRKQNPTSFIAVPLQLSFCRRVGTSLEGFPRLVHTSNSREKRRAYQIAKAQKTLAMSSSSQMRKATTTDESIVLLAHCPYSVETVIDFYMTETGWSDPPLDGAKNLLACNDHVAVCALDKRNANKLVALAFAVPTQTPYVPTSPAYALSFVIVAQSYRKKGLGRRVMSEVIRVCAEERR